MNAMRNADLQWLILPFSVSLGQIVFCWRFFKKRINYNTACYNYVAEYNVFSTFSLSGEYAMWQSSAQVAVFVYNFVM